MESFDITWANPNEAQAKALETALMLTKGKGMVLRKPNPEAPPEYNRPLTEFEIAEFICLADRSLWYIQAKEWIEKPPVSGDVPKVVFNRACKFIVDVVGSGYNADKKMWWDMSKYGGKAGLIKEYVIFADFMFMLDQLKQRTLLVVSPGFEVFARIQLGPDWRPRWEKLFTQLKGRVVA